METREYVEYLLKNYNEILKDIDQLKFEYEAFKDFASEEVIEALNFSSASGDRVITSDIPDKTCKIALVYNEVTKRMSKESREEIYKMMKAENDFKKILRIQIRESTNYQKRSTVRSF